jgi:hypothetical protein
MTRRCNCCDHLWDTEAEYLDHVEYMNSIGIFETEEN